MTLLYVVLAFLFGLALGRLGRHRTYAFQNSGEALLSRAVQRSFDAPSYHLLNHLTLQLEDGTTQVDHVLVSRFGVFVIETKHYGGWIFANAKQKSWTQVNFNAKFRFQNPIFQNFGHLRAIQTLLDFLPPEVIKSAVVFTGEAEFKTDVPQGVFTLPEFINYVREHTAEVMSMNRVQFCVGRLESMRLAITRMTDIEHVRNLRQRLGDRD